MKKIQSCGDAGRTVLMGWLSLISSLPWKTGAAIWAGFYSKKRGGQEVGVQTLAEGVATALLLTISPLGRVILIQYQ